MAAVVQTEFSEAELKLNFNSCLSERLKPAEIEILRPWGLETWSGNLINRYDPWTSTRLKLSWSWASYQSP